MVVENFRPDVKAKLGIDYESVRKINPRIVYGSISGFGQDGLGSQAPLASIRSRKAWAALMSITGAPGEGPMRVGIPVADLTAGLFCAMGILTALLEREVSGEGQWVKTSPLAGADLHAGFPGRALADGQGRRPAGWQRLYLTSIPTGVSGDLRRLHQHRHDRRRIWQRFCEALGAPDLVNRAEYATGPDRSKNRKAINAEINKFTEKKSSETWVKEFQHAAGVRVRPDLFMITSWCLRTRRSSISASPRTYPATKGATSAWSASPSRYRGRRASTAARPPEFGEQTEEVLAGIRSSKDDRPALCGRRRVV